MTVVVRAERVSYEVGGKALVSNMSLDVVSGRITIVIGPNGAGKSTLVRLLCGELRPSAGKVAYLEEPLHDIRPSRLACLRAVLPQASRLAFPFKVRQVVGIGLDGIGRGLSADGRATILDTALRQADLSHLAGRSYQTLSGGEQQRTQFGRILAQLAAGRTIEARQALFLDEPIASLDLRHQLALLEAATALARRGVGVLAVLHDLNLAAAFADEIVVMREGRMAAKGSPADVIDDSVLSGVFGVDLKVGEVPGGRRPFVLPRQSGT